MKTYRKIYENSYRLLTTDNKKVTMILTWCIVSKYNNIL